MDSILSFFRAWVMTSLCSWFESKLSMMIVFFPFTLQRPLLTAISGSNKLTVIMSIESSAVIFFRLSNCDIDSTFQMVVGSYLIDDSHYVIIESKYHQAY